MLWMEQLVLWEKSTRDVEDVRPAEGDGGGDADDYDDYDVKAHERYLQVVALMTPMDQGLRNDLKLDLDAPDYYRQLLQWQQ
jgi:hypothetical protein